MWYIKLTGMTSTTKCKLHFSTGGLEVRLNNIKLQLQSQFQRFIYQTLCVFSQIRDRNILNGIFIMLPGSCPRGGTWEWWG